MLFGSENKTVKEQIAGNRLTAAAILCFLLTISFFVIGAKSANAQLINSQAINFQAIDSQDMKAQVPELYQDNNPKEVAGITSLMSAAASGDIGGTQFFSKSGKSVVNQKNLGGATALHIAARERYPQIAKILIENGANVNVVDNEGWTPLMRAVLAADPDTTALLIDNQAQLSLLNFANESPIVLASRSDCVECLTAIFSRANLIKRMDYDLLRSQLEAAFVVAQNHDNKVTKEVISQYLDRIIKMHALLAGNGSAVIQTYEVMNDPNVIPGYKRVRFVISKRANIKKTYKAGHKKEEVVEEKPQPKLTESNLKLITNVISDKLYKLAEPFNKIIERRKQAKIAKEKQKPKDIKNSIMVQKIEKNKVTAQEKEAVKFVPQKSYKKLFKLKEGASANPNVKKNIYDSDNRFKVAPSRTAYRNIVSQRGYSAPKSKGFNKNRSKVFKFKRAKRGAITSDSEVRVIDLDDSSSNKVFRFKGE